MNVNPFRTIKNLKIELKLTVVCPKSSITQMLMNSMTVLAGGAIMDFYRILSQL